jgi:hypothetical protein
MDSFLADGMSPEQAEIRVEQFLSNPDMSVNIIWEAERKRFVEEEKVCLHACRFEPLCFCALFACMCFCACACVCMRGACLRTCMYERLSAPASKQARCLYTRERMPAV